MSASEDRATKEVLAILKPVFRGNKSYSISSRRQLEVVRAITSSSSYKDLKNHLHNTLGITKDDIRSIVEELIYGIVDRRVDVLIRDKLNVQSLVDQAISRKITERNWFWGESEDTLDDYIKKEVVRKLIDGVHLKVDVAKTKKSSTQTGDSRVKIRKTKKRT